MTFLGTYKPPAVNYLEISSKYENLLLIGDLNMSIVTRCQLEHTLATVQFKCTVTSLLPITHSNLY